MIRRPNRARFATESSTQVAAAPVSRHPAASQPQPNPATRRPNHPRRQAEATERSPLLKRGNAGSRVKARSYPIRSLAEAARAYLPAPAGKAVPWFVVPFSEGRVVEPFGTCDVTTPGVDGMFVALDVPGALWVST